MSEFMDEGGMMTMMMMMCVCVCRLRGGDVPRKTDFSDNIAHRDMEKYLTYEPIDVVSVCR